MIPAAALEQHLAILGKTGAGKTFAAKGIVEGILRDGGRACIIDPTGVWAGLRTNAAGNGPGFPVIVLGGKNGDVELQRNAGAAVGMAVATSGSSFVLDMLGLSLAAKAEFFCAFARTLLAENRGTLHLVIDEAHDFAPQSGGTRDPGSAEMLHVANNLVAQGRARGLRVMLLTQRPAKLHKDSLTQCESLIAMRVIHALDRKPVEDWMKGFTDPDLAAKVVLDLPRLKVGQGYVVEAEHGITLTTFPPITTFDTGRPGSQDQRPLAPVDVATLVAALRPPEPTPADDEMSVLELPEVRSAIRDAAARAHKRGFDDGLAQATVAKEEALRRVETVLRGAAAYVALGAPKNVGRDEPIRYIAEAAPEPIRIAPVAQSFDEFVAGFTPPRQALIRAVVSNHPRHVTRLDLSAMTGIALQNRGLSAGVAHLREAGLLIEVGQDVYAASPALRRAAGL